MKYYLFLAISVASTILFSLSTCTQSSCADIECLNGGICINGECDCPERWTGQDCSEQITPRFIRVKKVILDSFPEFNESNEPWDAGGNGPELTFRITDNGSPLIYEHPQYISNASHDAITEFNVTEELIIDPLKYYIFEYYDYDFGLDYELIGTGRTVPIGIYHTTFPDTIPAELGEINFSMVVEYEW